jgi:hypothetical protein
MFKRCAVLAVAAAALSSAALAGPAYVDAENKFELTLPDAGWTTEKGGDTDTKVIMNSPRKDQTGGNCRVLAGADATTTKSTQADVDKMLKTEINEAFWKSVFAGGADGKPYTIEKWGTEQRAAQIVYFAIAQLDVEAEDKSIVKVRAKQILIWVPGRFNWLNCSARADNWTIEEQAFEAIFASFRPT